MRRRSAQSYREEGREAAAPSSAFAEVPVCRVQMVKEGSRRVRETIDGPEDAAKVIAAHLEGVDREHFVVLMLDAQNRILGIHTAGVGTLTGVLVTPREVFKAAILANAAAIIVGHNHPSGDPTPSPEDHQVTEILRRAGVLLEIEVLDHIIVGHRPRFASAKRDRALDGTSAFAKTLI